MQGEIIMSRRRNRQRYTTSDNHAQDQSLAIYYSIEVDWQIGDGLGQEIVTSTRRHVRTMAANEASANKSATHNGSMVPPPPVDAVLPPVA
jgi:hypothetical protein